MLACPWLRSFTPVDGLFHHLVIAHPGSSAMNEGEGGVSGSEPG